MKRSHHTKKSDSLFRQALGFAYPFLLAALSLMAWKFNNRTFSDSIRVIQTHESSAVVSPDLGSVQP